MKRQSQRIAFAWSMVLIMLVTMYHLSYSESHQFNFDTLYPQNACMKATEQCVTVWGAWDRLIHAQPVSKVHLTRTIDRSIGQLVLAQRLLLKQEAGKQLPSDQMHYLSRVVGTIADRFAKLPSMDHDRKSCLQEYIDAIRTLVEQKINAF